MWTSLSEAREIAARRAAAMHLASSRVHAVEPFDEVPPPALRLVRRPAEAPQQPIADPRVGRIAQQGVGPLQLRQSIERYERRATRRIAGAVRRDDVLQGDEVWKSSRLVEVQVAAITLAVGVIILA